MSIIKISIEGESQSGTTCIARLIERVLDDVDIQVYFKDPDNTNENIDNYQNLDDKLLSISNKTNVRIETQHVRNNPWSNSFNNQAHLQSTPSGKPSTFYQMFNDQKQSLNERKELIKD